VLIRGTSFFDGEIKMKKHLVLGLALAMAAGAATAANTTPTTFPGTGLAGLDDLLDLVKALSEGTLGKVIATAMFLVGVAAGIVRQSIIAVVAGIGCAAALAFGPQVIDGVFSALI